jgi:hypothetical protein
LPTAQVSGGDQVFSRVFLAADAQLAALQFSGRPIQLINAARRQLGKQVGQNKNSGHFVRS